VDDRDPKVWSVLGKRLYGNQFADRGYISPSLFEALFADGVHLVTGIRNNMKNKLMPLWDKIMLRKRYIIECVNHLLKDKWKSRLRLTPEGGVALTPENVFILTP
ncbi:MAG: transposase, partial [Bacteroidaceae bacterium]|nr:transposase [Bacteroidaceae bacterium]